MRTQTHPLISPTLGTGRHLTSFHYGPIGGQKIYIQSSLHADELPGMLVAWALRKRLAALEAAGKLRGEIRSASTSICLARCSAASKPAPRAISTATSMTWPSS
jgi:predicted deacylase